MFRESITASPFDLLRCQSILSSGYFNGDNSLLYTLRALASTRLAGDRIVVNVYHTTVKSNAFAYDVFSDGSAWDNGIWIYDTNKSCYDECCANIKPNGFERIHKVTAFFKHTFEIACWIDEKRHRTLVITNGLDVKKYHFMQCAITVLLPWIFKDNPLNDLEMDVIKSFCSTNVNDYKTAMQKLADSMNLREAYIRDLLKGVERTAEQRRKNSIIEHMEALYVDLQSYKNRIEELLNEKEQYEIELLGLETKLAQDDGDSEIMEYFIVNKKLTLRNVRNGRIDFVVSDYITYYDEEMAEIAISNPRSWAYEYCDGNIFTRTRLEKLMRAIFLDQVLKVHVCAAYRLTINGEVRGLSGYDFEFECDQRMPNPHIQRHSCLGNYERYLYDLCSQHNYIGAIEQCIASCKSLNFGDSVVMREFMEDICTDRYECIELPDGTVVKPSSAIKWIYSQNKEEGNADE